MHVATHIEQIDPEKLGRFGEVLFDASFLAFVEDEHRGRADPRYFFIDGGTEFAAFTVGYVYTEEPIPFTFRLEEFLGREMPRAASGKRHRYLVLGTPIRLRSRVLADEAPVQAALIEGILEHARDDELAGVVFSFVHASDKRLVRALHEAGFASAFYEGDFYLPIDGAKTLDEFLARLLPDRRKQLRRDLNRFQRSGFVAEITPDLAGHAPTMASQYRALMDRYGREPDFDAASFTHFERHVPRRHLALACDGDRNPVAFVLSTFSKSTFEVLRFGRRADLDMMARVYGTLVFIESVRQAIVLGSQRVHLGKGSHRAKTLRGCAYEEGVVFVRWLSPGDQARITASLARLDAANRARFELLCRGSR